MISHDRAQQLISVRMDAPLTPAEHHELHGHLATCDACRVFVAGADELARGLQVLPQLAPSPAVSSAVRAVIFTENSGWDWLRRGLQTLSSPGMAVASGLALVLALAGAMFVALNAPNTDDGSGADPDGTIAAVVDEPLPTAVPTQTPAPEPTATRVPERMDSVGPAPAPAETPPSRPTSTTAPAAAPQEPSEAPVVGQQIVPAPVEQPPIEPAGDVPAVAMAPDETISDPSADLAQTAVEPVPSDEAAPEAETASEAAPEEAARGGDDNARRGDGGRRDNDGGGEATTEDAAPTAEPVPTEPLPVPDEAIAALESAGGASSDLALPPAPALPMPPSQAFLPITPTPESDGTPTPDSETPDSNTPADAPQVAEEWSGELGVTTLAPDVPEVTVVESEEIIDSEKTDKSAKDGKSHENQQRAYDDDIMGWAMSPVELAQIIAQPQVTDEAVATVTPAATAAPVTTTAPAPQYDPVTGYQIDPATGLLIDPVTGYLLDLVNGLVYHPGTGFQVHPFTGLLIDPVTGAQLDPMTLAIVIPAGFGSDTPDYDPGSGAMRGQIEAVVDETYDNATYKVIPATDGPVQPVNEIVVPTESGEAVELN